METAAPVFWQMWFVLALTAGAVFFYCTERLSIELTSTSAVAGLLLFFLLFPLPDGAKPFGAAEVLAGFANPALFTIMSLLVVGQGIFQTGALDGPSRALANVAETRPTLTIAAVFAGVFVVSAFMNNTPVVVIFLPLLSSLAARMNMASSKVLMPLSFVTILGGMTTMIGTSTNLLIGEVVKSSGVEPLAFFEPTLPGLALAAAGLMFLVIFGRFLLPRRESLEGSLTSGAGRQFIAQLEITADHPLTGKRAVAGMFPDLGEMTVRLIQRGEHAFLPPFDDIELRRGDALIVATTRQTLTDLLSKNSALVSGMLRADPAGLEAPADGESEAPSGGDEGVSIVESVVAPGSRFIGRTIEQIGFRAQTGCIVLGVQRRSRMIRARMSEIRLEAGDVLLVLGSPLAIRDLREQKDVLPLEWSIIDLPDLGRALQARAIFAMVIIAAATGLLPIMHAAFTGAVAMVATRCVNARQAARAFDLRIYLLIGSAFAMGSAMQATGAADFLGVGVMGVFAPYGPAVMLSAIFLLVAILTNLITNNAVAILFTPIAISAASQLGMDTTPVVLTVLFAANCSFATPIAYQTNLLVMGPGHYKFSDFVRLGAPMTLLMWAVYTVFAPWYFGL